MKESHLFGWRVYRTEITVNIINDWFTFDNIKLITANHKLLPGINIFEFLINCILATQNINDVSIRLSYLISVFFFFLIAYI